MSMFDKMKEFAEKAKDLLSDATKHASDMSEKAAEATKEGFEKAQEITGEAVKNVTEWSEKATATAKENLEKTQELASDSVKHVSEWTDTVAASAKGKPAQGSGIHRGRGQTRLRMGRKGHRVSQGKPT